ncbi:MAG TPA: hypothetical protein IAD07_08705 [Candidatus Fimivicinus intestinavium]|mgnify:CR=1|nr:hypothetical protein [Candidatus Fimivicinus intestinavium]
MAQRKKQPKKPSLTPEELAAIWSAPDVEIRSDVLGSYTGAAQPGEQPVQDADDL